MLNKTSKEQLLGGVMKDEGRYCHGNYKGFNFRLQPAGGRYDLTVAACSENDPGNQQLRSWLQQVMNVSPELITAVNAQNGSACVSFKSNGQKALTANTGNLADSIVEYLNAGGYRTCCESCGLPKDDIACFDINGSPYFMCGDCVSRIDESMMQHKEALAQSDSNLAMGLIGAFGGALIGALLWVLINRLGFIAGIAGYLMAFLAFKGYEKLGGSIDKKGCITCLAVTVVMLYLANKFSWALDAYSALKDGGWTFAECFSQLNYILKQTDLMGSYVLDLLIGIALTAFSSYRTFIAAFRNATGNYSITQK